MFRQKTTIVVGAGASCELGLPSGEKLKEQITSLLMPTDENMYGVKNDAMINAIKVRLGQANTVYAGGFFQLDTQELTDIKDAAKRIRRGLPLALSIDNFLHTHQADPQVVRLGKTAIAMTILDAEHGCALFETASPMRTQQMTRQGIARSMSITGKRIEESWYPPFSQLLMSGFERRTAHKVFENLRFVVFNYDRCLEQYLWLALQAYFDLTAQEAGSILRGVEFIHPYGSLGLVPWQTDDTNSIVRFGNAEGLNVWTVGSGIRTFTESVTSDLEPRIKSAIEEASTIILLGFGYLDQNVRLLMLGEKRNAARVMSTAYGVSEEDQVIVRESMAALARQVGAQLMVEPGACRAFFERFRLQLSLR